MHPYRLQVTVCAVTAALLIAGGGGQPVDAQDCIGACTEPDMVTVQDLVIGVSIALEQRDLRECPSLDADSDGRVTIDELVAAVLNALEGCIPHFFPDQCSRSPMLIPQPLGAAGVVFTDMATRAPTDPMLSCGCPQSPHTAWSQMTAAADGSATVALGGDDPHAVVAAFSGDCAAPSELACAAASGQSLPQITFPVLAGHTYLLEVSTACDAAGGRVSLETSVCGDAVVDGVEECDDGNQTPGDGCSATCAYESLAGIDQVGCLDSGGTINLQAVPLIGQVFVPTQPLLGAVDVLLANYDSAHDHAITLDVHAGSITGPIIASAIATDRVPDVGWLHFALATPVTVSPGQPYVIELTTDTDNFGWIRCAAAVGGAIFNGQRVSNENLAYRSFAAGAD